MKKSNKIIQSEVIANHCVAADHYAIELSFASLSSLSKSIIPGQFFMVKVQNNTLDPLLKIPLSVHNVDKDKLTLLYRVVGRATGILSAKRTGEIIEILGPLGNGFDLTLSTNAEKIIIVGGGCGVAPLYYLAKKIAKQHTTKKIVACLGALNNELLAGVDEFQQLEVETYTATDDGSRGYHGNVISLLREQQEFLKNSFIYASGPKRMLFELKKFCDEHKISAQVSLEEYMACGIGVCLGCAVDTIGGYKLCCKDGPVFNIEAIPYDKR